MPEVTPRILAAADKVDRDLDALDMSTRTLLALLRAGDMRPPGGGGGSPRYWRLYVTANNGRSTTNVAILELRDTIGGGQAATGGTASASSQFGTAFSPDRAFNGLTTDYWSSLASEMPTWLQYDMGSGNTLEVAQYSITARSDAGNGAPNTWELQWSSDGSSWTAADSRSGQTFAAGEEKVFTVP